jgi:two-component system, NarL family, nitrate/nitrite response regulator NarL
MLADDSLTPMDTAEPLRIALVDDHPTLLAGLAAILQSEGRIEVVGTGGTAVEALELARTMSPDVMVLDLSMPGDVFDAIEEMSSGTMGPRLVVFTAFASVELGLRAFDAGAHAFVLKGGPVDDIYDAIAAVRRGELFVSPAYSQQIVAGFHNRRRGEADSSVKLSTRERQLVDCLLEGKTNKEIARALDLSEKTVKHYMTNLMTKLQVKNRLEVVLAMKQIKPIDGLDLGVR